MKYYSLQNPSYTTSFQEAVVKGLAPNKGLFFPSVIPHLPEGFIEQIESYSNQEIAFQLISPYVAEAFETDILNRIINETLCFDLPLVTLSEKVGVLELFHGPTMAFKDIGARFMAQCLGHFYRNEDKEITVLVATSGDTGGAVANGFLKVPGVQVVILYPSGKVSPIQELQLTTLGHNIKALEVEGTFDDCQQMVKTAFMDQDLTDQSTLTSANSINVARWLPQMIYFLLGYKQLEEKNTPWVISVPSGNFGNLCAGMLAHKMGMPCHKFIASTNVNKTVPDYLKTALYNPKTSIQTISNAMDVGDPSNFRRILEIYKSDHEALTADLAGYWFTDDQTRGAIVALEQQFGYTADPHGAVAYLGLMKYMEGHPGVQGTFLETAHPAKFKEEVEATLSVTLDLPSQLASFAGRTKIAENIASYDDFKAYMMR
ncbi:MAG: threonine synthase [Flavobacteriaceae bacterium]|nr:threonine synthase [Flavobacteriaceae bacterium]MDH3796656.1 threonine synthase [Flavobacteriaceae bacterium]